MSIKTGLERVAKVFRGIGIIGFVISVIATVSQMIEWSKHESLTASTPGVMSRVEEGGFNLLIGAVFLGICWVIAYIIDGFAKTDR